MGGGFCPDDFHSTTEADLQQMSWGEDYWLYVDGLVRSGHRFIQTAQQKREYAYHDAAISQARSEGLVFHELPVEEQSTRLDAAEALLTDQERGI